MIMAVGLLVIAWFALQPVLIPTTGETSFENMLTPWVAKPGSWTMNPLAALEGPTQEAGPPTGFAILATVVGCITIFVIGLAGTGIPIRKSLPAVATVTLLAVLAWLASTQTIIKSLQLSYVLWAFVGGFYKQCHWNTNYKARITG